EWRIINFRSIETKIQFQDSQMTFACYNHAQSQFVLKKIPIIPTPHTVSTLTTFHAVPETVNYQRTRVLQHNAYPRGIENQSYQASNGLVAPNGRGIEIFMVLYGDGEVQVQAPFLTYEFYYYYCLSTINFLIQITIFTIVLLHFTMTQWIQNTKIRGKKCELNEESDNLKGLFEKDQVQGLLSHCWPTDNFGLCSPLNLFVYILENKIEFIRKQMIVIRALNERFDQLDQTEKHHTSEKAGR
ncbi:hypothetical protein PROFUN_17046, partial [Planoprotostelium fungivorum]